MSRRRPHLTIVESGLEELRQRFHALTGREPTPTELKAFARWKVVVGVGLPLATRQKAARIVSRL